MTDRDAARDPGRSPEPSGAPPPARVAERALVVSAVSSRALLEVDAGNEAARARLLRWLQDLGIERELQPEEASMLAAPIGGLEEAQAIAGAWQSEGLAVLGWALGVCDIPPHDQCVDPAQVADAVGLLDPQPRVLVRPELRSRAELVWCRNLLLALHDRVGEYAIRPEAIDFRTRPGADVAGIPLAGDPPDLAIDGLPIHGASRNALGRVASIAFERHRAIDWLLGGREWSEVDPAG